MSSVVIVDAQTGPSIVTVEGPGANPTALAGAGLTASGNTINVVGTTDRILVNADSVDIASTYVGQASITTLGTITTGTWGAEISTAVTANFASAVASVQFSGPAGSVAETAFNFGTPGTGLYQPSASNIGFSLAGASYMNLGAGALAVAGNFMLGWAATNNALGTFDTAFSKVSAGVVALGTGAAGSVAGVLWAAKIKLNTSLVGDSTTAIIATGSNTNSLDIYGKTSDDSANIRFIDHTDSSVRGSIIVNASSVMTLTPAGTNYVDISTGLRIDQATGVPTFTGADGLELTLNSIRSYNRTSAAYRALTLDALSYDLQISGTSKFTLAASTGAAAFVSTISATTITASAGFVGPNTTNTAGSVLAITGDLTTGIGYNTGNTALIFYRANAVQMVMRDAGAVLTSTLAFSWASTNGTVALPDTFMTRLAATRVMISGDGIGTATGQTGWVFGNIGTTTSGIWASGAQALSSTNYAIVANDGSTQINAKTNGNILLNIADVVKYGMYTTELRAGSAMTYGWSSATNPSSGVNDTALSRVAAGLVALGSGAAASFAGSLKLTDLFTNNAAALIKTNTTLTDGAGVGLGTLTTAPSAGNPTKWIGINDNGTTRYIPAW